MKYEIFSYPFIPRRQTLTRIRGRPATEPDTRERVPPANINQNITPKEVKYTNKI